jgi:hypothetical protein
VDNQAKRESKNGIAAAIFGGLFAVPLLLHAIASLFA